MMRMLQDHSKPPKNSKTGVAGVHFDKRMKKWRAEIYIQGKTIHLGSYLEKMDVIKARLEAEKKYAD